MRLKNSANMVCDFLSGSFFQIWKMFPIPPRNCFTECFIPRKNHLTTYAPELHYYCYCYTRSFVRCISLGSCRDLSVKLHIQFYVLMNASGGIIFKAKRDSYKKHSFTASAPSLELKRRNWTRAKRRRKKTLSFVFFTQSHSASLPEAFSYLLQLILYVSRYSV